MAIVGQIVKDEQNKLWLDIHLPFSNKERLGISTNTQKTPNDNQPDFNVYGLYGKVGGIWNKVSEKGNEYKSMSIDTAGRKLNFAIFKLEQPETVKNGLKTHSVNYDAPNQNSTSSSFNQNSNYNNSNHYNTNPVPSADDIPIEYENTNEIPF